MAMMDLCSLPGKYEEETLTRNKWPSIDSLLKLIVLPIRMPPGTMAETSPGTVFLLAAIWASSITRSTLDPSKPFTTSPLDQTSFQVCFLCWKSELIYRSNYMMKSEAYSIPFCHCLSICKWRSKKQITLDFKLTRTRWTSVPPDTKS